MISIIRDFLTAQWLTILKWGGLLLGSLFIFLKIRQSGEDAVQAAAAKKTAQLVGKSNEIENKIIKLPVGDAAKQLHNRWERK